MRYGHPKGASSEIYLVPTIPWEDIFRDPSRKLYFTEGWLKALAAAKFLGIPVLAYDGINNFAKGSVLLPIYNEIVWRGREVVLINDKDVPGNPDSLRGENLHARLLTERSVDAVWLCRYPKNCKYGKLDDALVANGATWFRQQVLKKAVQWDSVVAEEVIPPGITEAPLRERVVIPPMPAEAMYGIAKRITKEFATPPSVTYSAVLAALAAGGLIPHDMRRSAAKALRAAGVPESVIMATGGWRTPSMLRRYAIVSSADQRAAVELLERARAEKALSPNPALIAVKRTETRATTRNEKVQ